eukprot:CAMPEP_0170172050 /NCGR_PEP_ID=MMETSP0040_2-20121228/5274_1 /TAXON_ID=641309 /ORGANISM="Lotharella oceanica, Strain CCMP622" /LENGTH=311 /DNA_ID=CAMNT_0010412495 /DNA_START=6 /DNA_END=941 /DNA_ORIENTATION=+
MNITAALVALALTLVLGATGHSRLGAQPSLPPAGSPGDLRETKSRSSPSCVLMRLRGGGKVKSHSQSNMRKKLQRGGYRVDLMYQNDKHGLGRRRVDYLRKDYQHFKNDRWSIEQQPAKIAQMVETILKREAYLALKPARESQRLLTTFQRPLVAELRKRDPTRVYATVYDMVQMHRRVNRKAQELRRGSWDCPNPECGAFNFRNKKVCPKCQKTSRPNDWLCYQCFEAGNIRNTKACKRCGLVQEPRRDVLLLEHAASVPLPDFVEDQQEEGAGEEKPVKPLGGSANADAKAAKASNKKEPAAETQQEKK